MRRETLRAQLVEAESRLSEALIKLAEMTRERDEWRETTLGAMAQIAENAAQAEARERQAVTLLAKLDESRRTTKARCPYCGHPWPAGASMVLRPIHRADCEYSNYLAQREAPRTEGSANGE